MSRSGVEASPRARAIVYALAHEAPEGSRMSAAAAGRLVDVDRSTAAKWLRDDSIEKTRNIYYAEASDGTLKADIARLMAGEKIEQYRAEIGDLADRDPAVMSRPLSIQDSIDEVLEHAIETVQDTGVSPVVALIAEGIAEAEAEAWYARARDAGSPEHGLLRTALARWEIRTLKKAGEGGPDAKDLIKLLGVLFPERYTESNRLVVDSSELEKRDGPRLDDLSDEFGDGGLDL